MRLLKRALLASSKDRIQLVCFDCGYGCRWVLKPRLHERFFAYDGDAIFWKIVASPARGENRMCSHPRTGDATDEKIAEKNREKFNELNFLRQNHGLRQRVATQAIFAARWRRDNFQKIASPSQAKNRSCSRGLKGDLDGAIF